MNTHPDNHDKIVALLRRDIEQGMAISSAIRAVFKVYGEIYPVFLVDYIMDAFFVRHIDVMPFIFQWWHDPNISNITDEELDKSIEPYIDAAKHKWITKPTTNATHDKGPASQ